MEISNKKHIASNHMASFKQSKFREKELSDRVTISDERSSEYDINAQKLRDMAKKKDIKSATEKHITSLNLDGYMIPANHGRVAHMCLTFDGCDTKNYVTAMKTFISKMPDAKFTVLACNETDRDFLQRQVDSLAKKGIIKNPKRVNIINTDKNLSIWAQDSTLVMGNKVVEQDRTWFPGSDDSAVAGEVAGAYPSLQYKKLEGIYIDGGNQLATDDTLFVGSDAVKFMIDDMKPYPSLIRKVVNFFKGKKDNQEFSEKYEKLIDELHIENASDISKEDLCKVMMEKTFPHQKIVVVGHKGEQPSFHIDMAMTPLGKIDAETNRPVITVGDPSLAVDILTKLKKKNPDKYRTYEKEIKSKISGGEAHPLDTLIDGIKDDSELQDNFDSLAKKFESDGYKIERVPYLGSSDISGVPWITYNNSVIDGDNIFIPNFNIPELDNAGNEIYKKYGYKPVPIDMTAISSLSGAINCITKVLERVY